VDDLKQFLPGLMMACGGVLQWARQFKAFREWQYHIIAVALASGAYWLVTPFAGDWRHYVLSGIQFLTIGGGLAVIYGGTFIASNGAKAVAAANPGSGTDSVAVPVTNSK